MGNFLSGLLLRALFVCIGAAGLLATPADSVAQCVASTNASADASITVTATLHTSDPNENGEGEPLQVTSSDGQLNATVPSWPCWH